MINLSSFQLRQDTLKKVKALLQPEDRVMVVLDSNHSRAHVRSELELYAPLVTPGSLMVVTDGIMMDLWDVPGGRPEWKEDNPHRALHEFLETHPEFEIDSRLNRGETYFPEGYLRRRVG